LECREYSLIYGVYNSAYMVGVYPTAPQQLLSVWLESYISRARVTSLISFHTRIHYIFYSITTTTITLNVSITNLEQREYLLILSYHKRPTIWISSYL
jgi:hypothetical protein